MSTMNATTTVSVIRPEVNVPKVAPTLEHRPIIANPKVTTPKSEAVAGQIQVLTVNEQFIPIGCRIRPQVIPWRLASFTVGSLCHLVSTTLGVNQYYELDTGFRPVCRRVAELRGAIDGAVHGAPKNTPSHRSP